MATSGGLRRRGNLLGGVVLLVHVLLLGRLFYLQVVRGEAYEELKLRQMTVSRELPASRGQIIDRKGRVLATSIEVPSIVAEPRSVEDPVAAAGLLAPVLDVDEEILARRLSGDGWFAWLARQVEQRTADRVRDLDIRGIRVIDESKRVYPCGSVAAQLIGFTDIDERGIEGIERVYDGALRGIPGREVLARDARLKEMQLEGVRGVRPVLGDDITLTIDVAIQRIVEEELAKVGAAHTPVGACAVVLSVETGEVLAMANWPGFDPNAPRGSDPNAWRNRAVTDVYEPGSIFKAFAAAITLEKGLASVDERVYCEKGLWRIRARRLRDHHPYGWLTFDQGLIKSSNIWAAKMGMRIEPGEFRRALTSYGFGRPTGIELPGEASGALTPLGRWSYFTSTSVPMGHEVTVTALQMAAGYNVIASGGYATRPRITTRQRPVGCRRRVMNADVARTVAGLLGRVVTEGTGRRARSKLYPIAGKTGTAQKLEGGHYSHSKFIASFTSFAPADDPVITVVVSVDEPHNGYYGGTVAAPVAKRVIERVLMYMGIPPVRETTGSRAA